MKLGPHAGIAWVAPDPTAARWVARESHAETLDLLVKGEGGADEDGDARAGDFERAENKFFRQPKRRVRDHHDVMRRSI
jgi:hypothetical protein